MFLRLVERMLVLQPVLPQPHGDTDRPEGRDPGGGADGGPVRDVPDAG
ncbi:SAV-6107-like HEPN domain-containing protein OS=Streptomyces griseomycini OX=66895 GN=FHS37_000337 PE=4 SV=1 [Streptomyces griseomycini]